MADTPIYGSRFNGNIAVPNEETLNATDSCLIGTVVPVTSIRFLATKTPFYAPTTNKSLSGTFEECRKFITGSVSNFRMESTNDQGQVPKWYFYLRGVNCDDLMPEVPTPVPPNW
jgi:hypothetical protein